MITVPDSASNFSYSIKGICYIVGLVCIFAFFADMLIFGLPPQPGNIQWRLSILQQFGDRCIILLFGAALILLGNLDRRRIIKRLSRLYSVCGVIFMLMCLLTTGDSIALQKNKIVDISTQESQLQTQIKNVRKNFNAGENNISAEDLQKASKQLTDRANSLKQNTKTRAIKTGAATISNLVIVGIGLIGLGRYGMSLRKE